jgi:hypothetical protein
MSVEISHTHYEALLRAEHDAIELKRRIEYYVGEVNRLNNVIADRDFEIEQLKTKLSKAPYNELIQMRELAADKQSTIEELEAENQSLRERLAESKLIAASSQQSTLEAFMEAVNDSTELFHHSERATYSSISIPDLQEIVRKQSLTAQAEDKQMLQNETVKECYRLVAEYFKDEPYKVELWFMTKNHMLGNVAPATMIQMGREERLLRFIKAENETVTIRIEEADNKDAEGDE